MKYFAIIFFTVLIPSLVNAGGYYILKIDTYDPATGLYFKSISTKTSGFLSSGGQATTNILIYNPKTETGKKLFQENENFEIIALVFEKSVENGIVKFHSEYSSCIKNNQNIEPRSPKQKMLVLTRNAETKLETFYIANKDGSSLTKVKSINSSDDWHVDVKNSVVRIVRQIGSEIKIDNFQW